jgi:hypothetical protein
VLRWTDEKTNLLIHSRLRSRSCDSIDINFQVSVFPVSALHLSYVAQF